MELGIKVLKTFQFIKLCKGDMNHWSKTAKIILSWIIVLHSGTSTSQTDIQH